MTVGLVFCREAGATSDLIAAYDHGFWSHVDCVLPDGGLLGARDDVCAGIPAGVQIRPEGYAPFVSRQHVDLPATDAQGEAFFAFLRAQLGKPYDLDGLLGNFLFGRDWRAPDSWWCSELAGAALEPDVAGIFPFRLGTPLNRLTPDGLFLACSALADVHGG